MMEQEIKARLLLAADDVEMQAFSELETLLRASAYRIEVLEQELAETGKDAARYRWLIAQHWVEPEACFRLNMQETDDSHKYALDISAAIDAAIKGESA